MLSFKTQFPIKNEASLDDVMGCFRTWIAGSPHSKLSVALSEVTALNDDRVHAVGGERIVFAKYDSGDERVCAVRYENTDNDAVRWLTDVVASKSNEGFWVSVQLSVDSELPVERLESGRRPYVLRTLLEHIGGGEDGLLEVSRSPYQLSSQQLTLAADLICARANCILPVVYVSRKDDGSLHIDPILLASWLSGMSHVVVEPTRKFSFDLMREVYGENVYGGGVAIYFPDGIGKNTFLPSGKYSDPMEMQLAVQRKVRQSLLSQRTRRDCTWGYVQELKARRRISELKAQGSQEIDEYVAAFDRENASKNDEIQRLEQEVSRLRYSAVSMARSDPQDKGELVLDGKEHDLYQGERRQIVIDALLKESAASERFSRRHTLCEDLISSNNQGASEREQILADVRQALGGYTAMTAAVRGDLGRLGFEILDDGKHYKLIFRGDTRFPHVLAKTPSDARGVLNSISDMKRKLF